ncbi:hypothetical protein CAOG_04846 [Capsaspora owczarzaki ATCC 30864]|nr:hypothetical protein CAOG_04846 [Capsaspora owczarzaki ATCC 30864]|eukprot:XP_004347597.2 hypothetical protein CAOG_04846 [Capsaspora owczarzaki ATCC 30864]
MLVDISQELLVLLFQTLFEAISPDHTREVFDHIVEITSTVIVEADVLPEELLDVILAALLPEGKNRQRNKVSFVLAETVIKRCLRQMQPAIRDFFAGIFGVGKTSTSELTDSAYDLVFELFLIDSSLLLEVFSLLEEHSLNEDLPSRQQTIALLGRMFVVDDRDLANDNPGLWSCFLKRFVDVKDVVRLQCVSFAADIVRAHPRLASSVVAALGERLMDQEEKVRADALAQILQIAKTRSDVLDAPLLHRMAERTIDRKASIREEALSALVTIYLQQIEKFGESQAWSRDTIASFGWIPSKILASSLAPAGGAAYEKHFDKLLTSHASNAEARGARLVNVLSQLDEKGVTVFARDLEQRSGLIAAWRNFLAKHGSRPEAQMRRLAAFALDKTKAFDHIEKLESGMDQKTCQVLVHYFETDCSAPRLKVATDALTNRLGAKNPSLETVLSLLSSTTSLFGDKHVISAAIGKWIALDGDEYDTTGKCLLAVARVYPMTFHQLSTFQKVLDALRDADESVARPLLQLLAISGPKLQANHSSFFHELQQILQQFMLGDSPALGKLAVRTIVATATDANTLLQDVSADLMKRLELNFPDVITPIVCLGHIAELGRAVDPTSEAALSKEDLKICNQFFVKLLRTNTTKAVKMPANWNTETDDEWTDTPSPECLAKEAAIKAMTRIILNFPEKQDAVVKSCLDNVLFDGVRLRGEFVAANATHPIVCSRLYLTASKSILKIASTRHSKLIAAQDFQNLALTIEAVNRQVRHAFITCLDKYLTKVDRMRTSYMSILALAACNPDKDQLMLAKACLERQVARRRAIIQINKAYEKVLLPEAVLAHLIHLLAHHPDFKSDVDELKAMQKCIVFFVNGLSASGGENFDYLLDVVGAIKQHRDAQTPNNSVPLHTVCDVASLAITDVAQHSNWRLKKGSAAISLPAELFTLPSTPLRNTVVFLSKQQQQQLMGGKSPSGSPAKKLLEQVAPRSASRKAQGGSATTTPSKRAAPSTPGSVSRFKRRAARSDDDDEDDSDDEDGEAVARRHRAATTAAAAGPARRNASRAARSAAKSLGFEDDDDDDDVSNRRDASDNDDGQEQAGSGARRVRRRLDASNDDDNRPEDSLPAKSPRRSGATKPVFDEIAAPALSPLKSPKSPEHKSRRPVRNLSLGLDHEQSTPRYLSEAEKAREEDEHDQELLPAVDVAASKPKRAAAKTASVSESSPSRDADVAMHQDKRQRASRASARTTASSSVDSQSVSTSSQSQPSEPSEEPAIKRRSGRGKAAVEASAAPQTKVSAAVPAVGELDDGAAEEPVVTRRTTRRR